MYRGIIVNGLVGSVYVKDLDRHIHRIRGDQAERVELSTSLKHVNHSPTGFCWGYCGSGPHQTAFAILFDYLKDVNRTKRMYHDFVAKVVSKFPMDEGFELTDREIENFITAFETERMKEN